MGMRGLSVGRHVAAKDRSLEQVNNPAFTLSCPEHTTHHPDVEMRRVLAAPGGMCRPPYCRQLHQGQPAICHAAAVNTRDPASS